MEVYEVFIFIAIGLATGTIGGLLGLGGGIIYVPALLYILEQKVNFPFSITLTTVTSSLFIIFFSQLNGAYTYWKNGHVSIKALKFLIAGGASAAIISSFILASITSQTFKVALGILQISISLKMLFFSKQHLVKEVQHSSNILLFIFGLMAGFFSAFFGGGSGIIMVPLLHLVLKFAMPQAIGTSICLMLVNIFVALISYLYQGILQIGFLNHAMMGYLYLPVFLAITPAAFIGTKIGAKMAIKIKDNNKLKLIFGVFLLMIGLFNLSRGFNL